MPLFGKEKDSKKRSNGVKEVTKAASNELSDDDMKPKLNFHCQLAQGSPTGIISGFTNVRELYERIAACYDIKASDVRNIDTHGQLNFYYEEQRRNKQAVPSNLSWKDNNPFKAASNNHELTQHFKLLTDHLLHFEHAQG